MIFKKHFLRKLPAVDRILLHPLLLPLEKALPRSILVQAVQELIEERRRGIIRAKNEDEAQKIDLSLDNIARDALRVVKAKLSPSLRRVINATGTVLHTNLGRAPLARAAMEMLQEIASAYCNLEYSLKEGHRGSRHEHVESILCNLTGAEAACVFNNNAATVYLALNTLAKEKEVIVARGELVEIGGSFRIPEVMKASGAQLVEVGTTNKTYLADYEQAITEKTALLLKVHTSNYRIIGFTADVSIRELAALGKEKGIPVMEDIGNGALVNLSGFGLPAEPLLSESINAGAALVTCSGDKLLGGPQAGIIVGEKEKVERIKKNQMARALRIDKLTLAALEATLRLYQEEGKALKEITVLRMLTLKPSELKQKAETIRAKLADLCAGTADFQCAENISYVGGGAMPQAELPSYTVFVSPYEISVGTLIERLHAGTPPVVARIENDKLVLDPRTLQPGEEEALINAVASALGENSTGAF
ncbi:MAG: L-seryl-tRNA(Sec) selenium transferase [Firmicutes bacterium]|nr:L-seryl-tRNA(Sec) selenium transferase [Bacillota bacterium]